MNFMALAVIAQFDDAFYSALGSERNKKIIEDPAFEDLYKITRTSSVKAKRIENAFKKINPAGQDAEDFPNLIDDDTVPIDESGKSSIRSICVDLRQLPLGMMLLKCLYKVFRVIYVSVWFYFLPFLALLGSYIVPYYYQHSQGQIVF